MAKYQMRTRQTVSGWLERVRQEELARTAVMKQVYSPPPPPLVERVAQTTVFLNSIEMARQPNARRFFVGWSLPFQDIVIRTMPA